MPANAPYRYEVKLLEFNGKEYACGGFRYGKRIYNKNDPAKIEKLKEKFTHQRLRIPNIFSAFLL
jgi:hypothetical protein